MLDLAALQVPAPLADGRVTCRVPVDAELPTLARWAYEYETETLGGAASAEREASIARDYKPAASLRVLVDGGAPLAMTRFNAEIPDTVQVGGVYTPPQNRRRGYGRAVVAGSLLEARARGVRRSILFTSEHNIAARSAYLSLGYRIVGDYGLVLFGDGS